MARWRSPRLLLAACVATALLLVVADVRGSPLTSALRAVAGAVTGPGEKALASVRSGVVARVASDDLADRVARLEDEVARAQQEAALAAAAALSSQRLRELAALVPSQAHRAVPGQVVALSPAHDLVLSATLSVGSRDSVRVGQAVITTAGLAGFVASVAPGVATVRLVGDRATSLPVRVAGSGEVGILHGRGEAAQLQLLDPMGSMAVGDLVITMGAADGRTVPAGLPVGRIRQISGSAADLSRVAMVSLSVDVSTMAHVAVLVPEAAS